MARVMSEESRQPVSAEGVGTVPVDGRRLRTLRNRQRIVEALLRLIESGNYMPGAERVAEEAGVGLRSVFRHFSDMESLYREVGEALCRSVTPLVAAPLEGTSWLERLDALLERKILLMDRSQHLFLFGRVHRHDSLYARTAQEKTRATERKALARIWPAERAGDREQFEAVDLVLSFDTWVRLRIEQRLSVRRSRAVVRRLLAAVLDAAD